MDDCQGDNYEFLRTMATEELVQRLGEAAARIEEEAVVLTVGHALLSQRKVG